MYFNSTDDFIWFNADTLLQLYERRIRAALSRADTRHHTPMLHQLGTAGTSSDESDTENGVRKFHVKVARWRNPMLTAWLRTFDAIHRLNRYGPFTSDGRGAPPRDRFDSSISSSGQAPSGLPINAYSELWLSRLPRYHREDLGTSPAYDFSHSAEVMQCVLVYSCCKFWLTFFLRIALVYSGTSNSA